MATPQGLEQLAFNWPARGYRSDGLPMARVGWRFQVYFREPVARRSFDALQAIAEEYIRLADGRLRHIQIGSKEVYKPIALGQTPDLSGLQKDTRKAQPEFVLALSASPSDMDHSESSAWAMKVVSMKITGRADELGDLIAYLPLTGFAPADAGPKARALLLRWCDMLRAEHAYGGLGWVLPVNIGGQSAAVDLLGPLAHSFDGLDVDLPSTTSIKCRDGIRHVSWLTAVSGRLLDRLGGAPRVVEMAGPAISAHAYGHGTLFQAGPQPQIGFKDKGVVLHDQIALGRALKPLRADYGDLFSPPPDDPAYQGLEPAEAARRYSAPWLARFDGG
jgi:hypothetical protein